MKKILILLIAIYTTGTTFAQSNHKCNDNKVTDCSGSVKDVTLKVGGSYTPSGIDVGESKCDHKGCGGNVKKHKITYSSKRIDSPTRSRSFSFMSRSGSSGSGVNIDTSKPGTYEVTATCSEGCSGLGSGTVKVEAEVTSISGLGELYCDHSACSVTLKAVLTGGATALPQGVKVVWSGDATFSNQKGLTVKASFKGHVGENNKIKAKLSTQQKAYESGEFTVVDHKPVKGVNTVTYSITKATVPAGKYGITVCYAPRFDVKAYFDHPSHKWKVKVTKSTGEIGQGARLLQGPPIAMKEASVSAATKLNYSKMMADLNVLGFGRGIEWYMVSAVQAHEDVHADRWKMTNNLLFNSLRGIIERLSVPYSNNCKTAAHAYWAIKLLSAYNYAEKKYIKDGKTALQNRLSHGNPATDNACKTAERGIVDPMIANIMAHAISMRWHLLP